MAKNGLQEFLSFTLSVGLPFLTAQRQHPFYLLGFGGTMPAVTGSRTVGEHSLCRTRRWASLLWTTR